MSTKMKNLLLAMKQKVLRNDKMFLWTIVGMAIGSSMPNEAWMFVKLSPLFILIVFGLSGATDKLHDMYLGWRYKVLYPKKEAGND